MARKRGFLHRHFFVKKESTLLFRIAKSFYATNSYTTYFLQMTKSLGKSKRWIDFPWCNIFEMRSERKCSVFDLLWPDPSILEGESEKFVFLENKTCLRKKKMHKLSCLTKVYLCAKIETIWIFDPCHKNFIFVWFLQGCLPKCDSVILFCKVLLTGSFFPSNVTVTNRQLLKKSTTWSRKWLISEGNLHFEISSN